MLEHTFFDTIVLTAEPMGIFIVTADKQLRDRRDRPDMMVGMAGNPPVLE
jgi:hypothetical protein